MQKQAQSDTKGLLVVSFGTTHEETRKKTIDAIEQHLAEVFPDRRVYRGWTSRMILRILQKRTGSTFDTVEEALDRMAAEGREIRVHGIPVTFEAGICTQTAADFSFEDGLRLSDLEMLENKDRYHGRQ